MESLRNLEVNRLIKELDFIKSDYNYRSELIQSIDKEFINSVENFLNTHQSLKDIFDEKTKKNTEHQNIEQVQESNYFDEGQNEMVEVIDDTIVEIDENTKLKQLYRLIAKSTHPDRIKDTNLKELYVEATMAYDENNILPILSICNKLQIPYEISEDEIALVKEEIELTKKRIKFLESTFTWEWYRNEDIKIKDQVILKYIKQQISK